MNDFLAGLQLPEVAKTAIFAVLILLVTWIIATVLKSAIVKLSERVAFLNRTDGNGQALGTTLGTIASLVVWLFGLMALMDLFGQHNALAPIRAMLESFLGYLPRLIGAGIILFVGVMVAKIVRTLIETAMGAASVDQRLATVMSGKKGTDAKPFPLTNLVASFVFVMIVLVVAIAAVETLEIEAISVPLTAMLTTVFDMIPAIVTAAVLFTAGALLGGFLGNFAESAIAATGVDGKVNSLGLLPQGTNLSKLVAIVIHAVLVVLFAIMAFDVLNLPQVSAILNDVLSLTGQVLFGAVIIALGVVVAKFLTTLVSGPVKPVLYWGVIVLFSAMGLKFMGIADSIVNLAFGAAVIGVAAAAALAYGLGGREAAARSLENVGKCNKEI
ncbi:mechanosensitive ion channel [Dermabacteraceae bacterium TAE3-ERU27]|nr:mechanosensitive ion channel [Dermabacteraceae bacterium TAE3-ERU27]